MSYPEELPPADARSRSGPTAREGSLRLFLALWPDARVREALGRERDAWRWPPAARPVGDDQLHLTLHFIGAFARERVAALEAALVPVAIEAATLRAADRDVWKGGIAVLRFGRDARLSALHERLGAVLAELGVALDPRPFSPHVTLARRARGATPPATPAAISWTGHGFALVESLPGARPRYRVVRSFAAATA